MIKVKFRKPLGQKLNETYIEWKPSQILLPKKGKKELKGKCVIFQNILNNTSEICSSVRLDSQSTYFVLSNLQPEPINI